MNASSVLGNTRRAPKTADGAAEKQNVCQKRGKIQTAWQDVISEATMTPKRLKKQGFQRPKGRTYMPASDRGKHARHPEAADEAA